MASAPAWRPSAAAACSPGTTPDAPARFGFTATRKLGGAVVRNRARRRLKAAAALLGPGHARPGVDYVFVARAGTLDRSWEQLLRDVGQGFDRALEPARPRR